MWMLQKKERRMMKPLKTILADDKPAFWDKIFINFNAFTITTIFIMYNFYKNVLFFTKIGCINIECLDI
jgi:hypothetical protein